MCLLLFFLSALVIVKSFYSLYFLSLFIVYILFFLSAAILLLKSTQKQWQHIAVLKPFISVVNPLGAGIAQ